MGAWGYFPKDSDGALDLLSYVNDDISTRLLELEKKYGKPYDYAGVVMLVLQQGYAVPIKCVGAALTAVEVELHNTENGNQSGWKNQTIAIEQMKVLIDGFKDLLNNHVLGKKRTKANRRVMAPANWLRRSSEIFRENYSGLGNRFGVNVGELSPEETKMALEVEKLVAGVQMLAEIDLPLLNSAIAHSRLADGSIIEPDQQVILKSAAEKITLLVKELEEQKWKWLAESIEKQ